MESHVPRQSCGAGNTLGSSRQLGDTCRGRASIQPVQAEAQHWRCCLLGDRPEQEPAWSRELVHVCTVHSHYEVRRLSCVRLFLPGRSNWSNRRKRRRREKGRRKVMAHPRHHGYGCPRSSVSQRVTLRSGRRRVTDAPSGTHRARLNRVSISTPPASNRTLRRLA